MTVYVACPPCRVQAYEDATGKTAAANKEAFRAAMVGLWPAANRCRIARLHQLADAVQWPCSCTIVVTTSRTVMLAHPLLAPPQLNALERRLFFIPSFKIYGSVAGFYDYGPPGCAMKQNVTQTWRNHFVLEENMLEVGRHKGGRRRGARARGAGCGAAGACAPPALLTRPRRALAGGVPCCDPRDRAQGVGACGALHRLYGEVVEGWEKGRGGRHHCETQPCGSGCCGTSSRQCDG